MTKISLDTQILIAVLTNNASGHRTADEWKGIRSVAAAIHAGRAALVLPTIVLAELLPSHHGHAPLNVLTSLFGKELISVRKLSVTIASRAARLREAGILRSGRKLKAVDAIFIATAELAGCHCLYSADSDIYNATGARVHLSKPGSTQISFLPGTAFLRARRKEGRCRGVGQAARTVRANVHTRRSDGSVDQIFVRGAYRSSR